MLLRAASQGFVDVFSCSGFSRATVLWCIVRTNLLVPMCKDFLATRLKLRPACRDSLKELLHIFSTVAREGFIHCQRDGDFVFVLAFQPFSTYDLYFFA